MTTSKNIEIEIQVKLENINPLLKILEAQGKFIGEKHQIDEYFCPFHRNFLEIRPVKEWLRLRNADGKYSINYKNWHYDASGKSNFCDEYETAIDNLDSFEKIFESLNFKKITAVDKKRKIYIYKNYEISIDSVKNLGDFVEIEYYGENNQESDPKKITDGMINFLKDIGCGKIERNYIGYPFMLLFKNEIKYETC